ncbi:MAG: bifunctional UDP-N-acetylglucosamine diphosphorylase/glucosamine-1-phosphate N-acetyltransferase GlmU [Luminiphilus sp.]|jgi:bifunctional UDP-N-acetylglucosamine pyrophosphorylase / glucosamine-1-phosphate N-acetyltransferase|nr:bifunctional UDP-N-acetylglucosamine diphosphorylase/glucosamine-1-phosphate N-acetyltransferase GlmU [Luminiphilus sp.]
MLEVIILAAGKGSRMQSNLPKVLYPLAGRPLVNHVLDVARALGPERVHLVVGHGADLVQAAANAQDFVCHVQAEQLGTGHAALQAITSCNPDSTVLVLFGDVPLIGSDSLHGVIAAAGPGVALLSATLDEPVGYGRVIRDQQGGFLAVIEEADASPSEQAVKEINTGVLAAQASALMGWLSGVDNNNAQSEYYLPDVLALAKEQGAPVSVVESTNGLDTLGVNTPQQLEHLERLYQAKLVDQLMSAGAVVADRSRLDIRGQVQCCRDVRIDVNVVLEGNIALGEGVSIGANCVIRDAEIGAASQILPFSHIEGAVIKSGAVIGPYARLRPGTVVDDQARVGNFVEVKNTHLGKGAKASHLAYLGDAYIGSRSNVGAGTITCNYDGASKHRTTLGESVFVGSNSTLVAPVTIEDGGFVAAGSTITEDVKADQLAVARGRQRNVEGWTKPVKTEGKG